MLSVVGWFWTSDVVSAHNCGVCVCCAVTLSRRRRRRLLRVFTTAKLFQFFSFVFLFFIFCLCLSASQLHKRDVCTTTTTRWFNRKTNEKISFFFRLMRLYWNWVFVSISSVVFDDTSAVLQCFSGRLKPGFQYCIVHTPPKCTTFRFMRH